MQFASKPNKRYRQTTLAVVLKDGKVQPEWLRLQKIIYSQEEKSTQDSNIGRIIKFKLRYILPALSHLPLEYCKDLAHLIKDHKHKPMSGDEKI